MIASIRLAAIRDGLEDHEYLEMLKEAKGEEYVQALIKAIIDPQKPTVHTEDTQLFSTQRMAVLEALEAALTADEDGWP